MPQASPKPRSPKRGEESRRKILDAALVVIAKKGLPGATHRAIAAEAGVTLSLTTYFFRSLNDLIEQAFDRFVDLAASGNSDIMHRAKDYLSGFPPEALNRPDVRRKAHDDLSRMLAEFILRQARVNSVGIAVELNFFALFRLEPRIREKVVIYREQLVKDIAEIMRPLAPERPETDASLLLGLIHRLEFDCISQPDSPPAERVHAETRRLLGFILKI